MSAVDYGLYRPSDETIPTKAALAGAAIAPGACGELVQGAIDGIDLMVTCPINLYSKAQVRLVPAGCGVSTRWSGRVAHPATFDLRRRASPAEPADLARPAVGGEHAYRTNPADLVDRSRSAEQVRLADREKTKSAMAVELALIRLLGDRAVPVEVELCIESSLVIGKGMASSTADIAAAVAATAQAIGAEAAPDFIADIALEVEPSDGTMYPGICMFDHRRGLLRRVLGHPPPLEVIILDTGGGVDTVSFNLRPELAELNRKKEPRVREALELVTVGVKTGDPEAIGKAATISAFANQEMLPQPMLEGVARLAREVGAVGVNVAHSGALIGILFDPRRTTALEAESFVRRRLPDVGLKRAMVIGGGVTSIPPETFRQQGP